MPLRQLLESPKAIPDKSDLIYLKPDRQCLRINGHRLPSEPLTFSFFSAIFNSRSSIIVCRTSSSIQAPPVNCCYTNQLRINISISRYRIDPKARHNANTLFCIFQNMKREFHTISIAVLSSWFLLYCVKLFVLINHLLS